jgi:hypothetical protein
MGRPDLVPLATSTGRLILSLRAIEDGTVVTDLGAVHAGIAGMRIDPYFIFLR